MESTTQPDIQDTLISYVPALIIDHFNQAPGRSAEAFAEHRESALLFVDISGFTALAERLAQRGPVGAEFLGTILNNYFTKLIDHILNCGGDVIKFAGDALLALWTEEDLASAVDLAAQCGLAIQGSLHQYQAGEDIQLSMRIGITAGEIAVMHVGGMYGRWEFLVAGPPVGQIRSAVRQGQPGEVILSPQAWLLVKPNATGQLLSEGFARLEHMRASKLAVPLVRPEVSEDSITLLRGYLPRAILLRLVAGQTGWLAELRRLTVLFINLPDLDHTTPLEQAQTVARALQTILYRYEGSLNKLSVDDKGVTLVAALGLPPFAHENDAVRGVQVALAMREKLNELGVQCAIGVTTGRVFCGAIGSDKRREYTMIGNVINLAARLMQAATDQVVCDTATFQAARSQIAFEEGGSIQVKGKADPVCVYYPRQEIRSKPRARSGIVGRTAECTLFAQKLERLVKCEHADIILIEGEAGIGKSRLVEELFQQAQAKGVVPYAGAADPIERSTPYFAWRSIFSQVLNLSADLETMEARQTHVLAQLGDDPQVMRLAPLLNAVLPVDLPDNELTAQLTGEARAANMQDLLVGILQAKARQLPLLLLLEDAHWLDSASWGLAAAVSQRVQPILFVIATRPFGEQAPKEYNQLCAVPAAERLRLEPLPSNDIVSLISQRLGVSNLPEALVKLIQQKAEGHPFFSEELTFALRDSGFITIVDGQCRLAVEAKDFKTMNLPDTVEGAIASRIDRLTPSEQLTLKVASVIGRVFAYQLLKGIHPLEVDRPHLKAHLSMLHHLDITPLDTPEPDLSYIFKHVITQEVTYNLLLFERRRQLHQAVAEWYEANYRDDLAPYYALLAYHYGRAELTAKTLDYLEKAGEQALHSGGYQEAISFFSEALLLQNHSHLVNDRLRLSQWERQLGAAYYGLGRIAESREHLDKALAFLGRPTLTNKHRLTLNLMWQAMQQVWHRIAPASFFRASPDHWDQLSLVLKIYPTSMQVYVQQNELILTLHLIMQWLNLAESRGPCRELASAYAAMCGVTGVVGLYKVTDFYNRYALKTASELNDPDAEAQILLYAGYVKMQMGRFTTVDEDLNRAAEIFAELGDHRHHLESLALLSLTYYFRGEFERSRQRSADNYQLSHIRNDLQSQVTSQTTQAQNMMQLGKTDEAIALLEKIKESIPGLEGSPQQMWVYGILAQAYLRQNDTEKALRLAEKMAPHLPKQTQFLVYEGIAGIVDTYLAIMEATGPHCSIQHDQVTRQLLREFRKYARLFPIARSRAWLCQGRYDWLKNKPASAHRAWRTSLEYGLQFNMPYNQARAHFEIGRHLAISDPRRRESLTNARELFTRLGAAYDLEMSVF